MISERQIRMYIYADSNVYNIFDGSCQHMKIRKQNLFFYAALISLCLAGDWWAFHLFQFILLTMLWSVFKVFLGIKENTTILIVTHTFAINAIIVSICSVTRGSTVTGRQFKASISMWNSLQKRSLNFIGSSPSCVALAMI